MSLISADDNFPIIAILMAAVALGVVGENRKWFGVIPGILITILAGVLLASLNILPTGSDPSLNVPVYDFSFTYLIPFSIPLLLFNVEIKKIFKESGRLMLIFLIGAAAVSIGALIAGKILDLGDETYKVAGVFTATYTGGSVNFMAVASTFDFLESPLFAACIVVDNVFTLLFIMFLFILPRIFILKEGFPEADKNDIELKAVLDQNNEPLLLQLAESIFISAIIVGIGMYLADPIASLLSTDINLDVLIITILILIAANVFPKYLQKLENVAFQFGMFLLYFFIAVIGATCNLVDLFNSSPKVLIFAAIVLIFHLFATLGIGKLLKFSLEEIAIASGANSGGVSISAPMAVTFEMKKAVTPAILIGIMGYVVGTFLGVGVGLLLK